MYWCQRRLLFCELLIEIARVCAAVLQNSFSVEFRTRVRVGAYNCREVWWGYTFVQYIIPDDVLEEWLPLDLFCVSFPRAETAVRISCKKLYVINAQRWTGRALQKAQQIETDLLKNRNGISGHRDRV